MKKNKEFQPKLFESTHGNIEVEQKPIEYDDGYYKSLLPIKITPIYDTYWRFVQKRQDIFFNKINGKSYPWTDDQILQKYKFTNAYRASDRVSQYLIKNIIYSEPYEAQDIFFRIILFKLFNKIETWELIQKKVGSITYKDYDYYKYSEILSDAMKRSVKIYSAAYIMPPGKFKKTLRRKHMNHLKLLEMMIDDKAYEKIIDAKTFQEVFDILTSYPLIGKFLGVSVRNRFKL